MSGVGTIRGSRGGAARAPAPPDRTSALHGLLLLLASLSGLASCGPEPHPGDPRNGAAEPVSERSNTASKRAPNIVLLLIDTLRPDHLGHYGYEIDTAPYLRELGERSTVFLRAVSSSSWTAPSTASVFTGLYPTEHGIVEGFLAHKVRRARLTGEDTLESGAQSNLSAGADADESEDAGLEQASDGEILETVLRLNALPKRLGTLPELLSAQGYRTLGLATNINIDTAMGFDRGFDQFQCMVNADAAKVLEVVESWRDDILDEPSFLYLHFMDVHAPFHERAPLYQRSENKLTDMVSRYDSEIHYLDFHLRQLHESLGWDENTILCIVSDHGEEFRDHGRLGHGFSLYREVNQVLWMTHAPHLGVLSQRLEDNVSLIDVAPTVLDLADLELPADRSGVSVRDLLVHEDPPLRGQLAQRTLFAHRLMRIPRERELWAAIRGPYKLIEAFPEDERLLFTVDDTRELEDLEDQHPGIVTELQEQIARMRAAAVVSEASIEIELTDERRAALERLGYLEEVTLPIDDQDDAGGDDTENGGADREQDEPPLRTSFPTRESRDGDGRCP